MYIDAGGSVLKTDQLSDLQVPALCQHASTSTAVPLLTMAPEMGLGKCLSPDGTMGLSDAKNHIKKS